MTLNLLIGVFILENDLLFYDRYNDILTHQSYRLTLFLLLTMLVSSALVIPTHPLLLRHQRVSTGINWILCCCLACILLVPINLPFLGLKGSVSIYLLMALFPIVLMSVKSYRYYLLISLLVLVVGSQVFFDNKREVIFLAVLAIGIFGLRFFEFKLRHVLIFALTGVFVVLYLSLLRGYGGYNLTNYEKLFVVFDYVKNPANLGFIITNFELESASCNAIKNMESVLDGSLGLTYGEGFMKPFTMPIPRWMWPEKPMNYVTYYTSNVYPKLWAEGVSLPVMLVSEFFGSFKWLSLPMFPVFFMLLDRLYSSLIRSKSLVLASVGLVLSYTAIQYARGSGLEMYLYPIVFGMPFYLLFWKN